MIENTYELIRESKLKYRISASRLSEALKELHVFITDSAGN